MNINIPAGIDSEMVLRVKNKGNEATNGQAGDLILVVSIGESPLFKRDGFDILTEQNITVTEAILGG